LNKTRLGKRGCSYQYYSQPVSINCEIPICPSLMHWLQFVFMQCCLQCQNGEKLLSDSASDV